MSTHRSEPSVPVAIDTPEKAVSCMICQAVYAPSNAHSQLVRAPLSILESAFMSMCHFCFRCRRPACPSCWDDVHGVCGACALEAHLPFRSQADPLPGVLFPPSRRAQLKRMRPVSAPLVCVRPGTFQRAPLPVDAITTIQIPAVPPSPLLPPRSAQPLQRPVSLAGVTEQQRVRRATPIVPPSPPPVPSARFDRDMIAEIATRPGRRRVHIVHAIERAVTLALLIVLVALLVLVAVALIYPQVNAFVASVLHVDIRAEIAYLWQLVRHLF